MAVIVRIVAMRGGRARMAVGMEVRAPFVVTVNMEVDALGAKAAQHVQPQQDQHDADTELQRRRGLLRQGQPHQDDRRTDRKERDGVAEPPGRATQCEPAL